MATIKRKVKKAAKKAVKKAVSVPKVVPLTEYAGWRINRGLKTVSFGCGQVRAKKEDLRNLARAKFTEDERKIIRKWVYVMRTVSNIPKKDMHILLNMFSTKLDSIEALNNLATAASSHRTMHQISTIPPKTLLDIAGN